MKRTPLQRKTELKRTPLPRLASVKPGPLPKIKPRKCKVKDCREEYVSAQEFVQWCSPECGSVIAMAKLAKQKVTAARADRVETKVKLAKLKTRRDFLKEAQVAFNAYRREWCLVQGHTDCPSCGCTLNWNANQVDAGHFRSVGSAPHLRFTEDNVWAQCKKCNRFGGGRALEYRQGLRLRIGDSRVETLLNDDMPRKWSVEELKALAATYKQKLRELQKSRDTLAATGLPR